LAALRALTKLIEVANSLLCARKATPLGVMRRRLQQLAPLIAPVGFALRKSRVKAVFGVKPDELPPAEFQFRSSCNSRDCAAHAEAVASQGRICLGADQQRQWVRHWRPTALVLDLGRFASFDAYRDAI
jgi:hypothetical protein